MTSREVRQRPRKAFRLAATAQQQRQIGLEPSRIGSERSAAIALSVGGMLLVVAVWSAFGVTAVETLKLLGYELLIVAFPGIALLVAVRGRRDGALSIVAVGWALGYALELAAFAFTARSDARGWLPMYAVIVYSVTIPVIARRWRRGGMSNGTPRSPLSTVQVVACGAVLTVALAYLALGYYTQTPLPRDIGASVSYYGDQVFDLSLAAEAKHHWPMGNPSVVGTDLNYHTFAFMHMAAVSRATGVELSTVLFRSFPVPLMLLTGLLLVVLGRTTGRTPWVGVVALALFVLVGEPDLRTDERNAFGLTLFSNLYLSPTYLFAFPFFLAAVVILGRELQRRRGPGLLTGAALAVLYLAMLGGKATTLPLIVGALGLLLVLPVRTVAAARPAVLRHAALATGVFAVGFLILYGAGAGSGFTVDPFEFVSRTVLGKLDGLPEDGALATAVYGLSIGLATVLLALPLLPIALLFRRRDEVLRRDVLLLLLLLATSVGAFCLLSLPGGAQAYFLFYGYAAGLVVAAMGLHAFWGSWTSVAQRPIREAVVPGAIVLAACVLGAAILNRGPSSTFLFFLVYLGVATSVVVASVVVQRRNRGLRFPTLAILIAAVTIGLADTPLDLAPWVLQRAASGDPLHQTEQADRRGLTRSLAAGLQWVRRHTTPDTVLAVNNHWIGNNRDPRYFYYSALTERRMFLEAWAYTSEAHEVGYDDVLSGTKNPFAERLALNVAAIDEADPSALRRLRQSYGVRYVLVDRVHGSASPALDTRARRVFHNPALDVYEIGS